MAGTESERDRYRHAGRNSERHKLTEIAGETQKMTKTQTQAEGETQTGTHGD